ncbi:hypothetical protein B0H13DRAFT_2078056, partial [Mycena leptocephala]
MLCQFLTFCAACTLYQVLQIVIRHRRITTPSLQDADKIKNMGYGFDTPTSSSLGKPQLSVPRCCPEPPPSSFSLLRSS